MVLDKFRGWFNCIFEPVARAFCRISPNAITGISLIFAFFAGIFFFFSSPDETLENHFFLLAIIMVALNGIFDALDGMVAHLTGKTSLKGDFLDHSFDRFSDTLILGGIALSPWISSTWIPVLAIIGMLLTSYMGTQAQAIGCKREYGGLLGRADRLTILIVVPVIQYLLLVFNFEPPYYHFNLLEWTLIYFAVVGLVTVVQRFLSTWKWLNKR
jgi:archaetidylinositol phosphate synthase